MGKEIDSSSQKSKDEAFHLGARRRSQRLSLNANVKFLEPISAEGVVLNVSEGGMRVAVYQKLPADQLCKLQDWYVQVWIDQNTSFTKRARIVWSRELPDGWVIGLDFNGLN